MLACSACASVASTDARPTAVVQHAEERSGAPNVEGYSAALVGVTRDGSAGLTARLACAAVNFVRTSSA